MSLVVLSCFSVSVFLFALVSVPFSDNRKDPKKTLFVFLEIPDFLIFTKIRATVISVPLTTGKVQEKARGKARKYRGA